MSEPAAQPYDLSDPDAAEIARRIAEEEAAIEAATAAHAAAAADWRAQELAFEAVMQRRVRLVQALTALIGAEARQGPQEQRAARLAATIEAARATPTVTTTRRPTTTTAPPG